MTARGQQLGAAEVRSNVLDEIPSVPARSPQR